MELSAELFDWICQRVEGGLSQSQIARQLAVDGGALSRALSAWKATRPADTQRFARALKDSAEAWLDRGLEELENSGGSGDKVRVAAARAIAQECARRAAIRNAAYRDRSGVELSNPPGETFRVSELTPDEAIAQYAKLMG